MKMKTIECPMPNCHAGYVDVSSGGTAPCSMCVATGVIELDGLQSKMVEKLDLVRFWIAEGNVEGVVIMADMSDGRIETLKAVKEKKDEQDSSSVSD